MKLYKREIHCYLNSIDEARRIVSSIDDSIKVSSKMEEGRFGFGYPVKLELTLTPSDYTEGQVRKVARIVSELNSRLNSSADGYAELDPNIGLSDFALYGIRRVVSMFNRKECVSNA